MSHQEQLIQTIRVYNKKSIHEFIFIFIVSLAQIVFGGVFIEGMINKDLKEEDLVANLNVTSSFTIFVDVVFFMLTQKSFELHQTLIITVHRYRKILSFIFLTFQLISMTLICYFGVFICVRTMLKVPNPKNYYYVELIILFIIMRIILHGFNIKRQYVFFTKQLKKLRQIADLPSNSLNQLILLLDQDEEYEDQRQQMHVELMDRLPHISKQDIKQDKDLKEQVCLICLGDVLGMSPRKLRQMDVSCEQISMSSPEKGCNVDTQNYEKQTIVKLACGNKANTLYHKHCLSEWLKIKPECPLCRNVDLINTHILTASTQTDISSISGVTRVSNNRSATVRGARPPRNSNNNQRLNGSRQLSQTHSNDMYYHMIRF
eukprot:403373502